MSRIASILSFVAYAMLSFWLAAYIVDQTGWLSQIVWGVYLMLLFVALWLAFGAKR